MISFDITTTDDLSDFGRRINGGTAYRIPLTKYNLEQVKALGYAEDIQLPEYANKALNHPTVPKLLPYQKEAVQELVNTPSKGTLLYLSPGLGKGICSIVTTEILQHKCTLIVCSKTLIDMWIEELKKWSKDGEAVDYQIWHKEYNKEDAWRKARYCITTIETFSGRFTNALRNGRQVHTGVKRPSIFDATFECIIYDESLLLKNRHSTRFLAMKQTKYQKLILLSGNPASKYYDDLWSQLHCIRSDAFPSYWSFTNTVCRTNITPFATLILGNRKVNPADMYSDLIFRRTKDIVKADLPPLIFRDRTLELLPVQRTAHDEVLEDSIITLENGDTVNIAYRIAQFTILQQIVSSSNNIEGLEYQSIKHDAVIDMIESGDIEYPAIIWVNWIKGAKTLYNRIRDLNNGVTIGLGIGEDKTGIAHYKDNKLDILMLGMTVGKHGLTLTNSKSMIYVDRIFDADSYMQSLARVDRLTLKHSPTVTILRAKNSFDKVIEQKLQGKMGGIATLANADLAKLLRGIKYHDRS